MKYKNFDTVQLLQIETHLKLISKIEKNRYYWSIDLFLKISAGCTAASRLFSQTPDKA